MGSPPFPGLTAWPGPRWRPRGARQDRRPRLTRQDRSRILTAARWTRRSRLSLGSRTWRTMAHMNLWSVHSWWIRWRCRLRYRAWRCNGRCLSSHCRALLLLFVRHIRVRILIVLPACPGPPILLRRHEVLGNRQANQNINLQSGHTKSVLHPGPQQPTSPSWGYMKPLLLSPTPAMLPTFPIPKTNFL